MQARFTIDRIDTDNGQAIVTFIDPHGVADIRLAVDLPVKDGSFGTPDEIREHVAQHFPAWHFDAAKERREAADTANIKAMEGETFTVSIPDPGHRRDVVNTRAEPGETVTV
jgi:hypothetical protein